MEEKSGEEGGVEVARPWSKREWKKKAGGERRAGERGGPVG